MNPAPDMRTSARYILKLHTFFTSELGYKDYSFC